MTPAQQLAADRRKQMMMMALREKGDDGGIGALLGPVGGAAGAGDIGPTSVPLDAEQGPAMGGGLLHKGPAASAPAGRGITAPGKTHFFIKGRGPTIDFGPIFKPRSTGVDPLQGDPFQETKGVGGFFRRLLGDNSDELNSQWQQARIERRAAGEDRDAAFLNRMDEKGADQEFTQGENKLNRDANSTESAADRKHRRDMQDQGYFDQVSLNKMAQDAAAMRDVFGAEVGYDMQDRRIQGEKDVAGIRLLGTGGGGTPRQTSYKVGEVYNEGGRKFYFTEDKDGNLVEHTIGGGAQGKAGGISPEIAANVKAATLAKKNENEAGRLAQPVTAFDGVKALGSPMVDLAKGMIANPAITGITKRLLDPFIFQAKMGKNALEKIAEEKRRKEIADFYE